MSDGESVRQFGQYKWVEIDPAEVQRRLASEQPPLIVDVREPVEHREGVIEGALLLPLGQLPQRLAELAPGREIVVVCAHGQRSANATVFLNARGFAGAKSMAGGMSVWPGPVVLP